jgi:hypothetical protein
MDAKPAALAVLNLRVAEPGREGRRLDDPARSIRDRAASRRPECRPPATG